MKLYYLAGVLAMLAAPAFAEKTPVKPITKPTHITTEQCEMEKIILLLGMVQQDIQQMQADLEEIRGDREEQFPGKKISK